MQFLEAGRVGVHPGKNACTGSDQKRIPSKESWASGVQCWRQGFHVLGVKLSSASEFTHGDSTWRLFRCGRVGMRGLILFLGGQQ